jgi:hypothetical protein
VGWVGWCNSLLISLTLPAPASVFGSDVIVSGGLVFSAGAVGEDEMGKLVEGTVRDRTRAAMQVVKRRLGTVGLDWTDGEFSLRHSCTCAERKTLPRSTERMRRGCPRTCLPQ